MSARINLEEILKQLPERPFSDFIGKGTLPAGFLGGVETFRAIQNSFDPAIPLPKEAVRMFLVIKLCSAKSNKALKTVDDDIAEAIIKACESLLEGENIELLPTSPLFQTGSCTSLNMLANESLALLANYFVNDSTWPEDLNSLPINPNDHINKSQSSNDTSPTALRIMIYKQIEESFIPAVKALETNLTAKADDFENIVKSGRTHLQDAAPVTFKQEFSGYATRVAELKERLSSAAKIAGVLPIGGTAVGTEIDAPLGFDKKAVEFISEYLGYEFMSAQNKFAYQSTPTDLIEVMGVLLRASDTLAKIASDIRMSAAGPNNFINELELPVTQKGSSIMPGKINPVEIEQIMSLHSLVVGYNATVVQVCGQSFFQLTTAYPILIYVFYAAIDMLSTFYSKFADYLLDISVNIEKCKENVLNNPILLTRLKTTHGYSKATEVVNYSKEKKVSFFQAAMDVLGISRTEAEELLDPLAMTKPEIN